MSIEKDAREGQGKTSDYFLSDDFVQIEFWKWRFDPAFVHQDTWIDLEMRKVEYEDRRHEKRVGRSNFRTFHKKLKPDPYAEAEIERQRAERKKRRPATILRSDGALDRGMNPLYNMNKLFIDEEADGPYPFSSNTTKT